MSNSPRNVSFATTYIAICFFLLFLTTHAQNNPKIPDLMLKTIPDLHPASPAPTHSQTTPEVPDLTSPAPTHAQNNSKEIDSAPKQKAHSHAPAHAQRVPEVPDLVPKPTTPTHAQTNPKAPDSPPKANSTLHAPTHEHRSPKAPEIAPEPKPKSNVTSPNTKPSTSTSSSSTKPNGTTSPYHFANHFCMSRRLDVKTIFCLQVLKSSPTSMNVKENQELLAIAADVAMQFGNKALILLKKMSGDKTTKHDLKPVIEECVGAYEGYLKQYKMLVVEAKAEAQVASYDSELAKIEINRCAKALAKTWNADIDEQNKVALDYTKLSQNIADSID